MDTIVVRTFVVFLRSRASFAVCTIKKPSIAQHSFSQRAVSSRIVSGFCEPKPARNGTINDAIRMTLVKDRECSPFIWSAASPRSARSFDRASCARPQEAPMHPHIYPFTEIYGCRAHQSMPGKIRRNWNAGEPKRNRVGRNSRSPGSIRAIRESQ